MEGRIPDTVAGLRELDPHLVVAGHCTGWRAKVRTGWGKRVHGLPAKQRTGFPFDSSTTRDTTRLSMFSLA